MKTPRTAFLTGLIVTSVATLSATITHNEDVKIITSDGGTNLWIETDDNDSVLTFHDPGQYWFSMGIDKSDAGTFKIREGGDLTSSRGISLKTNGQVGIGTASPSTLLNVSAGTSGDAVLLIEADTDNSTEEDNPRIEFLQDGALVGAMVGFREEGVATNLLRISAYQPSNPVYNAITINPFSHSVGIRTDSPSGIFDVGGSFRAYTGFVIIQPQNSTNEGGQLILAGSASNPDWNFDSYADRLRIFNSAERLTILSSGNVGIGTSSPGNKLEVNGTIRTKEVIVETTGWPDDVFSEDYDLAPLPAIEAHIATHGHLPGVPSEAEVTGGVRVGEMQRILLRKVEELTLHLIRQQKEIETLRGNNVPLEEVSVIY